MNLLGHEIFRAYDEWGAIQVYEQGPRRYLSFGEGTEQSCIHLSNRAWLVYEYTQAMMLALLYQPSPQHVTLLGLGAGSLANCLLGYDARLEVTAVELRAQVVSIARQWFDLNDDQRLHIEVADAGSYMGRAPRCSDILFADIYTDHGMVETQLDEAFLADCYDNLSEQGVLVLNLWEEARGSHPLACERLSSLFGPAMLSCPVDDGNLILFAFKGGMPETNPRRLHQQATRIGRQLDIPLSRLAARLRAVW